MTKKIPRRQLDELITRWTLAKLPLVVVEGVSDKRFLTLVQRKDYCESVFKDFDVWPIEYIEVPAELVEKYGFNGTGSRQRVISFGREIELHGHVDGFLAIVDKDLDPLLKTDLRSKGIFYTDPCCMEVYSWSIESFSRLVDIFHCEKSISSPEKVKDLYLSINQACKDLSAARLAVIRNPELMAVLHESEKSLSLKGEILVLDFSKYLEQCAPRKGCLPEFKRAASIAQEEMEKLNSLDLIQGHDLVWLLTFVFRGFTELPKRTIDSELVASSLAASGAMNENLLDQPMFKAMAGWAASI